MRLFFTPGCPFAHRTRALLVHLDEPFEPREIDLAAKPADFLALSPTGKVPLLDDGGFVLYESAIINEYLAEHFAWRDALSIEPRQRARERLAMTQFDQVINPFFFRSLKDPRALAADQLAPIFRELDELALTVRESPPASLLGFHLATFWLRWTWLAPNSPLVARMRATAGLGEWLDRAVELPAVQKTSPEREATVRQTREKLGLVG